MFDSQGFSRMFESIDVQHFYPQTFNFIALFLFVLECYHLIGHCAVLFRLRLLPRKDLVRIRYYFLLDTLTVFTVSFVYTGTLRWLAALQMVQHLFFFFTWNENQYTKKVISWSSLDWTKTSGTHSRWEWDVILGTAFDAGVHSINTYILSQFLSIVEVGVALALVLGVSLLILFNSRLAWCSPSSVPAWINRRIRPVDMAEVQAASLF